MSVFGDLVFGEEHTYLVVQLDASDIQVSPNQVFLGYELSKSGFGTWEFSHSGFERLAV